MDNITEKEWNDYFRRVLMPNTIFLFLEMLLGTAGNSLVLFVYKSKMKNALEDRYFIPVLACLDIFASIALPAFLITDSLYWVAFPSGMMCKVFFFLGTCSSGASSHIIFLIALQRYLKICRPTGKQMSLFWKRISVLVVVIFSLSYASPLLYYYDTQQVSWVHEGKNVTGTMCIMSPDATDGSEIYYLAILFIFTFGNVIGASAMYAPIAYVIYKHFKLEKRTTIQINKGTDEDVQFDDATRSTETSDDQSEDLKPAAKPRQNRSTISGSTKTERGKIVKTNFNHMFLAIVVFYVVLYLPTYTFIFIVRTSENFWFSLSDAALGICVFVSRTFVLNHIINPIIYGYFDFKFRAELQKLQCSRMTTTGGNNYS